MLRIGLTLAVLAAWSPAAAEDARFGGQRPQVQLDLGLAVIGADFEHPVTPHIAVQLGAQVFSTYFAPWFDAGDKVVGVGGELRATWWRRDDGRGFYVAPFLRVARVTGERDDTSDSGVGFSAGVFAGWGFALTHRLDLRLGAGAQYMRYRTAPTAGPVEVDTPFVALDAVVGYRL